MKYGQETLLNGMRQRPKIEKPVVVIFVFYSQQKVLIWYLGIY